MLHTSFINLSFRFDERTGILRLEKSRYEFPREEEKYSRRAISEPRSDFHASLRNLEVCTLWRDDDLADCCGSRAIGPTRGARFQRN